MAEGRDKLNTPEQQLLLRWTDAYRALLDKLPDVQRPHEIKACLAGVYKDTDCYLGVIIDKGCGILWSRDWPTEPGFYWFYGLRLAWSPLINGIGGGLPFCEWPFSIYLPRCIHK